MARRPVWPLNGRRAQCSESASDLGLYVGADDGNRTDRQVPEVTVPADQFLLPEDVPLLADGQEIIREQRVQPDSTTPQLRVVKTTLQFKDLVGS